MPLTLVWYIYIWARGLFGPLGKNFYVESFDPTVSAAYIYAMSLQFTQFIC